MSEQTMAHQSSNLRQVVQDADTLAWLSADSNEARELIVEAKLPSRMALIQERDGRRSVPMGMDAGASAERAAVLAESETVTAVSIEGICLSWPVRFGVRDIQALEQAPHPSPLPLGEGTGTVRS